MCVCEYFISRRLHDGDDRRHKQKSSFLQQGIKLCDYSYLKICSIFVKVFVHYNLCIFIILIYSRVMRMHSYFIHTHIFTQTFTQSCIRACASLSQLFEFNIEMDSPVLSHILKLFFIVITSLPVISSSIHSDLSSFLVIPSFFTSSFFCAHPFPIVHIYTSLLISSFYSFRVLFIMIKEETVLSKVRLFRADCVGGIQFVFHFFLNVINSIPG